MLTSSMIVGIWDGNQGSDVMGCSGCVTNESHCLATARVGSQPASIMSRGGSGRRAIVAALTDQLSPPHESLVSLGTVLMNPYHPTVRVTRWITTASSHQRHNALALMM